MKMPNQSTRLAVGASTSTDQNEAVLPDLLLQPGSPHYTPCTTPHRPMDLGTFRADDRALQIDTDIVLALPF